LTCQVISAAPLVIHNFLVIAYENSSTWFEPFNRSIKMKKCNFLIFLLWIAVIIPSKDLKAQSLSFQVKEIVLKEKVLVATLDSYIATTKASVIAVFIERNDGDYTYTLHELDDLSFVRHNPTMSWGRYRKTMLLIYSGVEEVLAVDSTTQEALVKQMRSLLADDTVVTKVLDEKGQEVETITLRFFDAIVWRFKVREGKLLWVERNPEYQPGGLPYIKR
jgi:hypothetical protein